MANKKLFASLGGEPMTDTINEAGGKAYSLESEEALAQLAVTGCLNGTYYASEEEQLNSVTEHIGKCKPEFVAKLAIYAREKAFMKDMPALLAASLAHGNVELLKKVFPRIIDNGKMLRNFVQMIRSGKFGRKSFGTSIKNLIKNWINGRDDKQIFFDSVGNDPSMADVIKMVHPKPKNEIRNNLFAYLIGKKFDLEKLPKVVHDFEKYKKEKTGEAPNVPFQMLTSLDLGTEQWTTIAKNAGWQMTRMNLNTFSRHGVLKDKKMVELIAKRLGDEAEIKKARVFPYQIMMAYKAANPPRSRLDSYLEPDTKDDMPRKITDALQDAMEIAVSNIPAFDGKVFVFPDVSGSMSSPITGHRKGSTTAVRCIDAAALVAAAIMRKAKDACVIPFEQSVVNLKINPRDSIMTIAETIGSVGGGGTNCSAPLALINKKNETGDLIVYISDNESWVDTAGASHLGRGCGCLTCRGGRTSTVNEWMKFKKRNPKAKMVCIDIQAYDTVQAPNSRDILNVGGFSDSVFDVIARFLGEPDANWVKIIEEIKL
jgi:60 kDa SS-A/Ro ribonucleoprotein